MKNRPRGTGIVYSREEVHEFIIRFLQENQYPPTTREIKDGIGISSTSVVNYILKDLERNGKIKIVPNVARGIRDINRGTKIYMFTIKRVGKGNNPAEALADAVDGTRLDLLEIEDVEYEMIGEER